MTGKCDKQVSIYVKAAKDFSTEYHESSSAKKDGDDSNGECSATDSDSDDPSDDDDSDDDESDDDESDDDESDDDESAVDSGVSGPASAVEESDDEIIRRKRGNRRGKNKLLDFLRVAHTKLEQIKAYRNNIGADQYQQIRKKTKAALLAHDRSLKQVEADARNDELIAKFDSDQELLAKAKKTGVHRPPRVLGYYPIRPMGFKVSLTLLHLELDARGVSYDVSATVTKKRDLLKAHERKRYESEADAKLQELQQVSSDLNTLDRKLKFLQKYETEKDTSFGGQFDIDLNKFFKPLTNLPDDFGL
jgi:hypothetical protein